MGKMVEAVMAIQNEKNVKEYYSWRLPNTSSKTDINRWKDGINRFADQNKETIINEVNNIGKQDYSGSA